MESDPKPRIASSETLDNGIIVSFEDGTSIFYAADLLFSIREQGTSITGPGPDDSRHGNGSGPAVS
jgi:hypothetical protein